MSDSPACLIPWISMWPKPNGNIYPCCAVDIDEINLGHLSNTTLEQAFKSEKMNNLRKLFMTNKLDEKVCKKCIEREDTQGSSMRTMINDMFKHKTQELLNKTNEDGSVDYFNFYFADFVWSNKCNFKCVHCNPSVSNAIGQDVDFVNFYKFKNIEDIKPLNYQVNLDLTTVNPKIKDEFIHNINNVEVIHFNGGEPLMHEEHYEILDHLIAIGKTDVTLWIHTNGSILHYKGHNVIDYLTKFKNAKISLSHDGFGLRGEFNRYGYTDKKFLKTVKALKDNGIKHQTATCIHGFNIWHLPEIMNWYDEHGLNNYNNLNVVTSPLHVHYAFHDYETRLAIYEKLENYIKTIDNQIFKNKLIKINNKLQQELIVPDKTYDKIKWYLDIKLDKLNQNAREIFPEYNNFFNKIGWNNG